MPFKVAGRLATREAAEAYTVITEVPTVPAATITVPPCPFDHDHYYVHGDTYDTLQEALNAAAAFGFENANIQADDKDGNTVAEYDPENPGDGWEKS